MAKNRHDLRLGKAGRHDRRRGRCRLDDLRIMRVGFRQRREGQQFLGRKRVGFAVLAAKLTIVAARGSDHRDRQAVRDEQDRVHGAVGIQLLVDLGLPLFLRGNNITVLGPLDALSQSGRSKTLASSARRGRLWEPPCRLGDGEPKVSVLSEFHDGPRRDFGSIAPMVKTRVTGHAAVAN